MKATIQKNYGWYFLAKEVSDFSGISFYDVLERSALEVLSTVMIIQAKIEFTNLKSNA